jgi:hypothetical protein
MQITARKGAELPDRGLVWLDTDGNLINFTTYTFQLKIGLTADGAAVLTKTTGITGAATSPNVTISFAAGELDSLSAETEYVCQLMATSGTKQRGFPDFTLWLTPAMT